MAMASVNDLPWIPFAASRFIESLILRPDSRVFEYGSGGSTVWFAARSGFFVSVENRANWYAQVKRKLEELGRIDKVEYLLRPKGPRGFEPYILAIDDYEPFDVVFVDGRERTSCMKRAVPKIKSGGYLILDNPDLYPPPRGLFTGWESYRFNAFGWDALPGGGIKVAQMWPCNIYRNADERNCQEW